MRNQPVTTLVLYPIIPNHVLTGNLFNRITWGLKGINKVRVWYQTLVIPYWEKHLLFPVPASQAPYYPSPQAPDFQPVPTEQGVFNLLKKANRILVWQANALHEPELQPWLEKVSLIDPEYRLNHEADQIAALQFDLKTMQSQQHLRQNSIKNFTRLVQRFENSTCACFYLTGPSLQSVHKLIPPPNSVRIICNSLVKDHPLMEILQPHILTFSDPAYHFGVSQYANMFRQEAAAAMENYPELICIVPERYLPLINADFGAGMEKRLIGMPVVEQETFNFLSLDQFFTRFTGNILTQFMLPIASRLSEKVIIYGADGRAPSDLGFWQHAPTVQIGSLMSTIYESHPALTRDEQVEEYYRIHCYMLERLLMEGETMGINYHSGTPSFIPALSQRVLNDPL